LSAPQYQLACPGNFAIEFFRHLDRWQHRWVVDIDGQIVPLLTSEEGDDSQNWPPSPPLQELDHLSVSAGPAIFGVGRGGVAHWSVSLLLENPSGQGTHPEGDSPAATVVTEWACCWNATSADPHQPQPRFQSSYQLATGVQGEQLSENLVQLTFLNESLMIQAFDAPPHQSICHLEGDRLTVAAKRTAESTANVRWNYRIWLKPKK